MESHYHSPDTYQGNMDWRSSTTTFPCRCCKYNKAADSRDPSGLVDYIFSGRGADDGLDVASSSFEAMSISSTIFDSTENEFTSFNTVPFDSGRDYSYPAWVDQTQNHESLIENGKTIQSNWNEFVYFDSQNTSSFGKEAADRSFVAGGVPDQYDYESNYCRSWANANSFDDMIFSGENNNVDVTSSFIEAICNYEDGYPHRVHCNGTRSRWPASEYEDNDSFSSWDVMGFIDNILNVACPAIKALGNFIGDVFISRRKVHICVNDLGTPGRRRGNDLGSLGRPRPAYPLAPTDISAIPTAPSKPDKKEADGNKIYPSIPDIPDKIEGNAYDYFRKDAQDAQKLADKYSKLKRDAQANGDHISADLYKQKAEEQRKLAEEKHKIAAKNILAHHNKGFDQWTLDLHGLHESEAIDALCDRLQSVKNVPGQQKRLTVITGKGIHSKGDPVLPGAVRDQLDELGYDFEVDGGRVLITL